jgi:hypothetical protein
MLIEFTRVLPDRGKGKVLVDSRCVQYVQEGKPWTLVGLAGRELMVWEEAPEVVRRVWGMQEAVR